MGGGGGGSREAGMGVSSESFQTQGTGTVVWWAGALLSVFSDCLVTWLSRGFTGLDALLLDALQCPFNSPLVTASPMVSPILPDLRFSQ